MEQQQLQDFNERLSQWISNQGFWFQVRYSMTGSGNRGKLMFHLLRILFRIFLFLLLVAGVILVLLLKRTDSSRFVKAQQELIKEGLLATDFDMQGYRRTQGKLEITRFAATGGDQTFYTNLEARNIRADMGLTDGLIGVWNPGVVAIARIELDLRAGANDSASASKIADTLFHRSSKVEINTIEVGNTNIRWGFSDRTQGSISESKMIATRQGDGWRVILKGGGFNQNWLENLEIVHIEATCDRNGIVFDRAELRNKGGTVSFDGLKVAGGARPIVSGVTKIRNLNLESILPPALTPFIEGSISGEFKTTGSTNSSEGVGFEGLVTLDGTDSISLRERIHILKSLSIVDYARNYHRVDFREGSFYLRTSNGGMEARDVNVKADDLFTLRGQIRVRIPTEAEKRADILKGGGIQDAAVASVGDATSIGQQTSQSGGDFTLKQAAQAAQRIKDGLQSADSIAVFDRSAVNSEIRRLEQLESERLSRMLRYEGAFVATIPGDAFERAPRLLEKYPRDPATGRIPVPIPVEGDIYDVTLKQAEETKFLRER